MEGGGVREEFSREWRGRSEERGWRGRSSTRERAGRGEDEGYNSTGEVAPSPSLSPCSCSCSCSTPFFSGEREEQKQEI